MASCFGFLPRVCGCPTADKRAAGDLRRARNRCAELQKRVAAAREPEALPTEHLRAAEHHLAALERWLVGGGATDFDDLHFLSSEVGSTGLDHEESAMVFEHIFAASKGEVLVKTLPCLARAGSLKYPGKLFLSSMHVCFHATVFGAIASFACPWRDIASIRLMKRESLTMHAVQVSMKSPMEFAGVDLTQLNLDFFDVTSLGDFDKCVNYFTGHDLLGLWQKADSARSLAKSVSRLKNSMISRKFSLSAVNSAQSHLENEGTVWELQRRVTIWHSKWKAPFLPHDGLKRQRWMVMTPDKGYLPHPFLARADDASPRWSTSQVVEPPIASVEFMGQERPCSWHAVVDVNSDEDGWQYAVDFYPSPDQWTPYCSGFSHVRRRMWQPVFSTRHRLSSPTSEATVLQRKRPCLDTTVLAQRGLGASMTEVLRADIEAVSLAALAKAFEAEDWRSPGGLMAMYFQEVQAVDLDIHEWTDLAGVEGRARSVEMRVPVPPAPMCPRETRCNSIWHVYVSPSQVVVESVTMSLDVPYGTSFNVVVCDTFSHGGGGSGGVQMVRSMAVEWVASIWMKSLVEQNVPPQIKDVGVRWVGVLQRWAGASWPSWMG